MDTIVVKGSDYSSNDLKLIKDSVHTVQKWDKLVKIILIYPSGIVKETVSSYNTFNIVTDDDNSIIYK